MIYSRCSRCGKRIPSGYRCECYSIRYKEYDKYSRDKDAAKFYHSTKWGAVRDQVLNLDDYMDVYLYMTEGIVVAADTVHHIVPLADDPGKKFSLENLISLSHSTHSTIHKKYLVNKAETIKELQKIIFDFRNRGI